MLAELHMHRRNYMTALNALQDLHGLESCRVRITSSFAFPWAACRHKPEVMRLCTSLGILHPGLSQPLAVRATCVFLIHSGSPGDQVSFLCITAMAAITASSCLRQSCLRTASSQIWFLPLAHLTSRTASRALICHAFPAGSMNQLSAHASPLQSVFMRSVLLIRPAIITRHDPAWCHGCMYCRSLRISRPKCRSATFTVARSMWRSRGQQPCGSFFPKRTALAMSRTIEQTFSWMCDPVPV